MTIDGVHYNESGQGITRMLHLYVEHPTVLSDVLSTLDYTQQTTMKEYPHSLTQFEK